jgi:GH43 family beta-xylosidase
MDLKKIRNKLLVYTRDPKEDYTESLSNSIHFAYCDTEDDCFVPLNNNYGILFARATIDDQNIIREKGLKVPYLFKSSSDSFGIIAIRVTKEGEEDPESIGQILLWTSEDLINFEYVGLVRLHHSIMVQKAVCDYRHEEGRYVIRWQGWDGLWYKNILACLSDPDSITFPELIPACSIEVPMGSLTDIAPGNVLDINHSRKEALCSYWLPIFNTEFTVPDQVTVSSPKELMEVKATAKYSDGSVSMKQVIWNSEKIDFSVSGTYTIHGKAVQERYEFPLASGYADPVILPYHGKYYFISTNDNKNDIGREAETIQGLFAADFTEALILDVEEEKGLIQTFWAPEFHRIGGELYILFAVSNKTWGPQCHMMKLKRGGSILNPSDWEEPVRVKKRNGTYLAEDGITLDMTYFKADGISCVVWSYRKGIGTPCDTGSMLYIATVDERNPAILTSEPVLLSRPLYGWENIQGTINNEGPYPLITADTVYLTYSGGAACGYTYVLGLLSIPRGSDFLNAGAWKKSSTPVLSYYSIDGVYGPGHNSFFQDYDGNIMILYHGEQELVPFGNRCTGLHRLHFDRQGRPRFDLSYDRDFNTQLADVVTEIVLDYPKNMSECI